MPKNCPFCGAHTEIVSTTFGDNPCEYYRVQCLGSKQHSLDQWDDTEFEAVDTWNERPQEDYVKILALPGDNTADQKFDEWLDTKKLILGRISTSIKDCPLEFQEIVDKHFWELI